MVWLFLPLFFTAYFGATYYAGAWWVELMGNWLPALAQWCWALIVPLSLVPIGSRILHRSGVADAEILTIIGDYWLAVVFSSVLARAGLAVCWLAGSSLGLLPPAAKAGSGFAAGSFLVIAVVLAYGLWAARHPVVRTYDIRVVKAKGTPFMFRAVMVSDLHLGGIVGRNRLEKLVSRISKLAPDIAFLAGDSIDDDVAYVAKNRITEPLAALKLRYGVYAVLGNHEYISGQPDQAACLLEDVGVTVLRDQLVEVQGKFIVAGRDDLWKERYSGQRRKPLNELLTDINRDLPLILLDHQPRTLAEAAEAGVDIQLSGHTHKGQFFPLNFVTAAVHENNWGLVERGRLSSIVSCGFGTWGPPIRIGNRPEIVLLRITVE